MTASGAEPPASTEDHAYFRAVEDIFIGLRGAPLMLSPADFRVVQRWHREGIPVPLIRSALEEVFARRRERGAKGTVSSLRYCARAVEEAWEEVRELTAPGRRQVAEPLAVAPRLERLAASLPAELPGRTELARRLTALGSGPAEAVEEELTRLDRQLVETVEASLSPADRERLDDEVTASLKALAGRLPRDEVERARRRLRTQLLRRQHQLPLLSLFAAGEAADEET